MAINGNNARPDLQFQQVQLKKGGIYNYTTDNAGKLSFLNGTSFPYGLDVDTRANFQGPFKIDAAGGNIQLGATHGTGPSTATDGYENSEAWTGALDPFDGGDTITVFGDQWHLSAYAAVAASDKRAKTKIKPIPNALNMLKKLTGNSFEWKFSIKPGDDVKPGDKDYGVIAQEVQKIMPEVVDEKNGWLMVNYNKLIPLLIESIKELSEEVEKLKGK